MPYNSIENKITNKIKKGGRGNFFFASDFVQYFIFYRYCKLTLLIYKKIELHEKKVYCTQNNMQENVQVLAKTIG